MALRTRPERSEGRAWRTDDTEALRIRASFGQLARDLAASRPSCAAARERVGPVLANL